MTLPAPEAHPQGHLVGLQVGKPRSTRLEDGTIWRSGIHKGPVEGPITLEGESLEGDKVADRRYHGGPDKAVCCYCLEHYESWGEWMGVPLPHGAFGENFTTAGLTEEDTCVGDIFRVGTAMVQVSQHRGPCVNLIRRWGQPQLPREMEQTGRTGYYLRVLQGGAVRRGDAILLQERPFPGWSVLRLVRALYGKHPPREELEGWLSLPILSSECKRGFERKLRADGR